jgi:hypothetical protein
MIPTLKIPINIENLETKPRNSMPQPQASVPKRSHPEPCSGTLLEGGSSPEAIFIIPTVSMKRRE